MASEGEQLNRLLQQLSRGDAEALDGICACIGGRMFALACGIVKNRADAEDVVSESFLKLARGIGRYRPGTNAPAFVMRIVRNCALDWLRRRKVRAEEDIDACFRLADERTDAASVEQTVMLETALSKLTKEERRMIYFRYYLDFTVRETAKELGLSKSSVQRQTAAAEEKLRKWLSEGQNRG